MERIPISRNGLREDELTSARQDHINTLTRITPSIKVTSDRMLEGKDVILIPIHDSKERLRTVGVTLYSIKELIGNESVRVVIADNGISDEIKNGIIEIATCLNLDLTIENARPYDETQKSPAYARNQVLKKIKHLGEQRPDLRPKRILFVDSDMGLHPEAIMAMRQAMETKDDAVAVTGKTVAVDYLDQEIYMRIFQGTRLKQAKKIRTLPQLINVDQNTIDYTKVVAYGSDVATKTSCLYVDYSILHDILLRDIPPFVRMPRGSAEDMLLSVAFNNFGKSLQIVDGLALDQNRETLEGTMKQRAQWGFDHGILTGDLANLGLITKGLHIFEPTRNGWIEWVYPGTEDHMTGIIIHPEQLYRIAEWTKNFIEEVGVTELSKIIGIPMVQEEVNFGLDLFYFLYEKINSLRNKVAFSYRDDFPIPVETDEKEIRYSPESRVGQLLGNIMSIHAMQTVEYGIVPKQFLMGVRQSGKFY